ncbi:MAG TPA: sigma factor-like helix-turn-helix DNA-binding protein [Candidatus Doudnabacteria bacterium]|nr:sigma factor-like helix-turn-helix DNA-binding protein [Candidatus Doudnabacteria bacterium]
MGILDTIIDAQQKESLQEFELNLIIDKILNPLKEREKAILSKRYGLNGKDVATLKSVGEEQGLTRERVRQIEKELLKNLKRGVVELEDFISARELFLNTITEHGGIMSEQALTNYLGYTDPADIQALKFLLRLISEIEEHSADQHIRQSWSKIGFDRDFLHSFILTTKQLLDGHGKPISADEFLEQFTKSDFHQKHETRLTPKVVLNYLHTTQAIQKNPFDEYGLAHWNEIKPKDVGDKAYLVMKHHGKPEHYSVITDLINRNNIDTRRAYKETVHNKLIKDKRFVLVGRGIYALTEWGYKPGVVSDIITEVIKEEGQPLSRDEIVKRVLKRRLVKKNTVLVGLSNKKLFKKVGKNLYDIAK